MRLASVVFATIMSTAASADPVHPVSAALFAGHVAAMAEHCELPDLRPRGLAGRIIEADRQALSAQLGVYETEREAAVRGFGISIRQATDERQRIICWANHSAAVQYMLDRVAQDPALLQPR